MSISLKRLNFLVDKLNTLTGNHDSQEVGCYFLSHSSGCVELDRITDSGTGFRDVFGCGYETKDVLYGKIVALIDGINAANRGV